MKVITESHPYSFWGNLKMPDGLELDIPDELVEPLETRGFITKKDVYEARMAKEKANVAAHLKAKEEKRLAAMKPASEPEKTPELETKKPKGKKE